uniref:ABC transporter substrate-binding protein n=1 Tax=Acetatifactor sp. TaxID=1872090 RepID=UPI004055DDD1
MYKKFVAILLLLALLLTSCGDSAAEELLQEDASVGMEQNGEDAVVEWTINEYALPDADEALTTEILQEGQEASEIICGMVDNTVFRVVELNEGMEQIGVCIQKLEKPYEDWHHYPIYREEWLEGMNCYVSGVTLGQDGSVYTLLRSWDGSGNENYFMSRWTEQGEYTVTRIENENINGEFVTNTALCWVDKNENSYFSSSGGIHYFDKAYAVMKEWQDTGYVFQMMEHTEENIIYLCGCAIDGYFRIWTMEEKEPLFVADDLFMNQNGTVVFADAENGFLCTPEGIWEFSIKDGSYEQNISFYEQGYAIKRIYGGRIQNDILTVVAQSDGKLVLLEKVVDTKVQDKVALELATLVSTPFLREAIVAFNKKSDQCYIELREPEEGEEYSDFKTRIQAEISSGKGPDLFTNSIMDIEVAVEKGISQNLSQYFTAQKEELLENVRALGEMDGEIYAVPYSFGVNALVTSAEAVGERKNWNLKELMNTVQTSGAEAVLGCYEGAELFSSLTMYTGSNDEMLDWENARVTFDSENVVSVLEFAKEYRDTGTWENREIRIVEGDVLATTESITDLSGAKKMEALFQGAEVYIGYPVTDDRNGNVVWGFTISINTACDHSEEALAFIRYLLSPETQDMLARDACDNELGSSGFPVLSEALENMFSYAEAQWEEVSPNHTITVICGGYEYVEQPLSQESLEKLKDLLYHARPTVHDTEGISHIIEEETPAFFAGEKSAQEVLDIVQNRAQLYMDEK